MFNVFTEACHVHLRTIPFRGFFLCIMLFLLLATLPPLCDVRPIFIMNNSCTFYKKEADVCDADDVTVTVQDKKPRSYGCGMPSP